MLNLNVNIIYRVSFKRGVTWNPMTWLGFLIRLIADVKYNHTGVLFNENGKWYLQEAIDKGVVTTEVQNSNAVSYYEYFSIELLWDRDIDYSSAIKTMRLLEGKKYDFKSLLFYQLWLNLFNKWIGKAIHGKDRYYCYEHVAEVFELPNAYKIKPKEMNKMFKTIAEAEITCLR